MSASTSAMLRKLAGIIEEVGVKTGKVVNAEVLCGRMGCHVDPDECVRLIQVLRIANSAIETRTVDENFHVVFHHRNVRFNACIRVGSDADIAFRKKMSGSAATRITGRKPPGLPAPKVLIGELVD